MNLGVSLFCHQSNIFNFMEEVFDFRLIANIIFENKERYTEISDNDKEKAFFILNRKFSAHFPEQAQFVNSKSINRATALDMWFNFFKKKNINRIPSWYWIKIEKVKVIKDFTNKEIEIFKKYNSHFSESDFEYIFKNFKDEVRHEVKFLSKFED